jgi:phytoene synthase
MSQSNATNTSQPASDQADVQHDPSSVLAHSSFHAGILLLPPKLQRDARRLYHLLRTIDDLVDENDPSARQRVAAIESWAHGREPDTPEVRMLATLKRQYPIPRRAILDFCDGMHHDLSRAAIETEADLQRYCEQAGGSVGIMLASLLGTSHPDGENAMATLGTAMQHTNILRDIDEDREHGRLYIPRSTIQRFGEPLPSARAELLRHEIGRADALYEQGAAATALLSRGRQAMALSAALYREILREIERHGFGRKPGRVKVADWRKALLIAEHSKSRAQAAGQTRTDQPLPTHGELP